MANMGVGALPALKSPLEVMNQHELRTVIPQIIRNETGVRPHFGNQNMKPKWWPDELPYCNPREDFRDCSLRQKSWSDVLRSIIRRCYQYYGQDHLLKVGDTENENPVRKMNTRDRSNLFVGKSAVFTLEDRQNTPYASCPPTMEAATPGMLQSASTGSSQPLPMGLFRSTPCSRAPPGGVKSSVEETSDKPFIEVFMCFFCEKEFHQKSQLQVHQKQCDNIPPEFKGAVPYLSHTRKKPEAVHIIPRKPRKLIEDKVNFPSKPVYVESLGLLPQAKAESVRRQSRGKKIDCDVIEVDGSKRTKTPTTPRTPKSLMAQLSRDASPPARVRLKIGDDLVEDEDNDDVTDITESSDEESESEKSVTGDKYRPRRAVTLLSIDVSSLLGERVQKHISAYFANLETYQTSPESSNKNYESFCRTPTKNKVTERLRSRGKDAFQVTFKKSKRTAPAHSHVYKFRRSQLVEHCRIVETGLNRRARALKRQIKKCKVVLQRLSDKDLKRWTKRSRKFPVKPVKPSPATSLNINSSPNKQVIFSKFFNSISRPSQMANNVPPSAIPSGKHQEEIRRLLVASSSGQSTSVSRQLQLSVLADETFSPGTMQQKLLYRNLLSGSVPTAVVTGTPADLTPPSTPEQPSPICVDDDDIICLDDCSSYNQTQTEQMSTSLGLRKIGPANPGQKQVGENHKQSRNTESRRNKTNIRDTVIIDNDKSSQEDDVISISSTESASDLTIVSPESLKRSRDWTPESGLPAKRRRIDQIRPAALLFRCHLCYEEITCHDNANLYIKEHFAKSHNVYNIDLIEHLDTNGHKVVSIVEVPTPEKVPPPSSFILTNRANSTPAVVPTQFYSGQKKQERKIKTAARTKQQAKRKPANVKPVTGVKKKNTKNTSASKVKNAVKKSKASKAIAVSKKTVKSKTQGVTSKTKIVDKKDAKKATKVQGLDKKKIVLKIKNKATTGIGVTGKSSAAKENVIKRK